MKSLKGKRVLYIILAAILLLSLAACGKTIGTAKETTAAVAKETTKDSAKDTKTKNDTSPKKDTSKTTDNTANGQEPEGAASNDENGGNNTGYVSGNDGVSNSSGSSGASSSSGGSPQPQTEAPTDPPAPTWTISVTVDAGPYGGVFGGGTYTYYYQPNAFDALVSTGLPYTGSGYYVSSINGLAEFDHGRMSGWLYAVNGVEPNVGCGSYYLNDGDTVYWHYQGDE